MGFLGKLFGRQPRPFLQLCQTLKLEMAVEVMMTTWLYRFLTESLGVSEPKAIKIVEDVARAEIFQTIQKNAIERAAAKIRVPAPILERFHLVQALIAFYDGNRNRAAVVLVQKLEYPALERMIKSDMIATGKCSKTDYMSALKNGSAEAYSLGNEALMEWAQANLQLLLHPLGDQQNKKQKILVTDDCPSTLQMMKTIIEDFGYEVVISQSKIEAIEKLREIKPDLVTTDLNSPKMSGFEFIRAVKEVDPSIPVIVSSGNLTAENAREAVRLGVFDCLRKPFNVVELRRVVDRALETRISASQS
jgi:CheY-like chemotaxis protein